MIETRVNVWTENVYFYHFIALKLINF